jgi:puromycin-sensitive aminopeptidase
MVTSKAAGSVAHVTIDNPYRLPRNVRPVHYDLTLEPDLPAASFIGKVSISIEVSEVTDVLVLNAAELEIRNARVELADGTTIAATGVEFDEETERATISMSSDVPLGSSVLCCDFSGILNDKLRGFYRSTYTGDDGAEHTIATTQFESTQARRAFPCFDEPALKATFGVTLVVDDALTAVSCSNVIASEQLPDGRRRDQFADTMVMSTYLVAFIVGELEITDPIDVGGVPLRIVHVPGKGHLTDFGLEAGAFSLQWLVDYYGIPYPGDKLDLVAVPDFAFGAMENLGCVTFRETLLLANPDTSTQAELTRIVDVIAHEIAHMWFGDLVTMDWWNGIWLKEAFATFMQVATTDAFRPGWHRWDSFSLERGAAFDTDALTTTRPIEYPVISPADAEGMYDVLTYEKGAAVVRMLEQFLEPAAFQAGIKHYLERYSYANTETTDLWDALEEATGAPVRSTMDSWIFQGGHPIIAVTPTDSGIEVSQRQFSYSGAASDASWSVPLIMRASVPGIDGVTEVRHLLEGESASIDLGGRPDWVVVNSGGHGFYRVRYEASLLKTLAGNALETLPPAERYGLVDDLFAAVIAGEAEAAQFLELVTELGSETDLGVWQRMLGGIAQLHAIAEPDGRARLARLVRDLATTALGILGFEPIDDEPPLDRELRAVLFEYAGGLGEDQLVQRTARTIVDELIEDPAQVEPNLATAAMRVVAANGTDDDYERFLNQFHQAGTPQAELRFLNALVEFPSLALFEQTLELARTEVRSQNAPFLLMGAMRHLDHGPRAWVFVRDNWDELLEKFPENSIPRLVGGVRGLSTEALADDVDAFLDAHPIPQGTLMVAQHREKMRVNVALRAREGSRLG